METSDCPGFFSPKINTCKLRGLAHTLGIVRLGGTEVMRGTYVGAEQNSNEILPLPNQANENLDREIRYFVRNKFLMDKAVAEQGADLLAGELHDGAYGPHEALDFFAKVFPFVRNSTADAPRFFALARTSHTVGCSWRWRTRDLSQVKQEDALRRVQDKDALLNGTIDNVTYFWIRAFGLVLPVEGKNRVDFLREKSVDLIPAKVAELEYPASDRLKIMTVTFSGLKQQWAVLDDRWVQRINYPSWSLPVLKAYGVKGDLKWPDHYPVTRDVGLAFDRSSRHKTSPLGHPLYPNLPVVDLHTVQAESEHSEESVDSSLIDLEGVTIRPEFWMIAGAVCLLSMVALLIIPRTWHEAGIAFGFLVGCSIGGVAICTSKLLRTPRRLLKRNFRLPYEKAPKGGAAGS